METITTSRGASPKGPYSQGVRVGPWVFVSGQGGFDPATGEVVGDTLEAQTEQAMRNIGAVLEAAGCSFDDVVKTTVHLADGNAYEPFNRVYRSFFGDRLPARTTSEAGPPGGLLVVIDATAYRER